MRDDFDAPLLPSDVEASELAGEARMQLKTLDKDNADVVARHLAMVARLIDDDPKAAHQHALAASRRAGRIGMVRETLAITAYQLEDFGLALRELRTFRRITGSDEQLPLMVDCERGLGRPEKALELSRSVDASTLPTPVRVELAIARSGARLDLGQTQAALDELRIPELQRDVAHSYSPALFAAFATVLEELGKADEAAEWHELADRAIDALEAAAEPGASETVQVTEEWIHVADEDLDVDVHVDELDDVEEVEASAGESGSDDADADDAADAEAADDAEADAATLDDTTPVDTSAEAIEAEVAALLAGVEDTTDDDSLFAIDADEAGESASDVADAEAARGVEATPDAPAHEAGDADEEPRA